MSLFARSQLPQPTISGGSASWFHQAAGQSVTPETAKQKVAYQASVNLLAGMASTLPVTVRRKRVGVMVPVPDPPVLRDPEGLGYGLGDFTYKWVSQNLTRGNCFVASGPLDATNRPTVVQVLDPTRIQLVPLGDSYGVRMPSGEVKPLYSSTQPDGVKHSRAYSVPGQILGESVIGNHARTLGLALASEEFGAQFFGDGAHPTGLLTSDQPVTEDGARTAKERIMAALRGNREPLVLGGGLKFQQIQVSPEESQFLATQGYTDAQICRIFGPSVAEMLGYETGGKLTYANVESNLLQFLLLALNPWLVRYERFLSDYLLEPGEFATIDRNALLQMTATNRWNVHKTRLLQGATTINEVRAEEGQTPLEWGDEPYMPAFATSSATVTAQAEEPQEGTTP